MTGDTFDAAIIGAGPGGSSAALTLARRGQRVVLLEAHRLAHPKVCGEFLSPECADLLQDLDLTRRIQTLEPATIHSVRLTAASGVVWENRLPRPGWGLSRSALDAALAEGAEQAGAQVVDETTVTHVHGGLARGFELETSRGVFRARMVIAGHGKRATLDRLFDRAFMRRPQPYLALQAHFHGPALDHRIELHTFPGGYCGLAEIEGDRRNVCLLVREGVFRRVTAQTCSPVEAFVHWMQSQNPYLHQWLAKAERIDPRWRSIAQIPFGRKALVEQDVLMVGDAAGLIAPLAGDGIAMALQSGTMAGKQAHTFLTGRSSDAEMRRDYAAQWRREFSRRIWLGRVLQLILVEPRISSLGLNAVRFTPGLGDYLVRHTRDSRTQWS